MRRRLTLLTLLVAASVPLAADTLILRDGSRVDGELLEVRNGRIEFRERRGFGSGRVLRFDREEVRRIELDGMGNGGFGGGGGGGFGSGGGGFDSGGRPSGMRERVVTVSATSAWNDTGIDLRPGQTVQFEASGRVRWGRGRQDGPGGEGNSPFNPGRPMPNRSAGALLGKVGVGDEIFFIGDERGPIRVRGAGRLYLGVNDDFLDDNSGAFRVIVYY